MDILDLHGIRHYKVRIMVEDFIATASLPAIIITGNSATMQGIVREVLLNYNLKYEPENDYNLGSWIIKDS